MIEESFVSLESLTEAQWNEIEKIAAAVISSKAFGNNVCRASVAAFCMFLIDHDIGLGVDVPDKKKRVTKQEQVH